MKTASLSARLTLLLFSIAFAGSAHAQTEINVTADDWAQWRGPRATGVSSTASPPTHWSEDQGVKWKTAIDGNGSAPPIVWRDRVYVLTAIDTGVVDPSLPRPEDQPKRVFNITHPNTTFRFEVICLNRATGNTIWRRTATEMIPHEGHHGDNDFASAAPTTDGKRLYCWFGSAGIYCYTLEGELLWKRDLGKAYMGASLGEGCSPVVYNDRVVIVRDQQKQSSIEVLDAANGKTSWKAKRNEPNAWATPAVVERNGVVQVITAASNRVRSYNLDSGEIIWECGGLTSNVIPCPMVSGDVVYCMSGYKGHALMAIPITEKGDFTDDNKVLWRRDRGTPYVPSALLYDGLLFFNQSNRGIWSVVDAKSGESVLGPMRLPGIGNIYSSPVGAAGRIYVTSREGKTLVLKHSRKFEVIAENKLDDRFDSSPALAGNQLFLRGEKYLYCLAND